MKRIAALFCALRASFAPARQPTDAREACMAIEREYASQPYPFEWE